VQELVQILHHHEIDLASAPLLPDLIFELGMHAVVQRSPGLVGQHGHVRAAAQKLQRRRVVRLVVEDEDVLGLAVVVQEVRQQGRLVPVDRVDVEGWVSVRQGEGGVAGDSSWNDLNGHGGTLVAQLESIRKLVQQPIDPCTADLSVVDPGVVVEYHPASQLHLGQKQLAVQVHLLRRMVAVDEGKVKRVVGKFGDLVGREPTAHHKFIRDRCSVGKEAFVLPSEPTVKIRKDLGLFDVAVVPGVDAEQPTVGVLAQPFHDQVGTPTFERADLHTLHGPRRCRRE